MKIILRWFDERRQVESEIEKRGERDSLLPGVGCRGVREPCSLNNS